MFSIKTFPYVVLYLRFCNHIGRSILRPSSNRFPYIFMLIQKVKHRVYKIHFAQTLQVISFKKDFTSCTDEVREKVPSFQKVTLFQ